MRTFLRMVSFSLLVLLGYISLFNVPSVLGQQSQDATINSYMGRWNGNWNQDSYSGTAWVTIRRDVSGVLVAEFILEGIGATGTGKKEFTLIASIEGTDLVMKSSSSITRLTVSDKAISGSYEFTKGPLTGQRGTYSFKRV